MHQHFRRLGVILCTLFLTHNAIGQACFTIESILVDACGSPEGQNEMVRFRIGDSPLDAANLNVIWPNGSNSWDGVCQDASTANKIAQLNSTIVNCGFLREPVNGVLPANSGVILVSSVAFNPENNSFANLSDTLYVIFHCSTQPTGNFANAGTGIRTLSMAFSGAGGCNSSVSYDRAELIGGNGALANFDSNGNVSYDNQGCSAPIIIPDPSWTPPSPLCNTANPIDLNSLITGNMGGTWEGPGVSGNIFNPNGLTGEIDVTYTVGVTGCQTGNASETNTIQLIAGGSSNWTSPGSICSTSGALNLNDYITGDPGGTWSGSGVSGNVFNPSGQNGEVEITYTLGSGNCESSTTQSIIVEIGGNSSWTPLTVCATEDPINLNNLVTGDNGGTWSGDGISGASFNPNGLSGNIPITYTVGSGNCAAATTQYINVTESADASWNPIDLCSNESPIDLNTLVIGTQGGTWSGVGVAGSFFSPNGLNGSIPITYTVGSQDCSLSSTQNLDVTESADASWSPIGVCESEPPLDLNTLITGTMGGTWSGTGVSETTFNSSGLSGNVSITYTVGSGNCSANSTQNINVIESADASWLTTNLCSNESPIDLNTLITGTQGGTWSGDGVSESNFNPSGLLGEVAITYSVGTGNCQDNQTNTIEVISIPEPPFLLSDTSYCENTIPPTLVATISTGAGIEWIYWNNPESVLSTTVNLVPPQNLSGEFGARQILNGCFSNYNLVNVDVLESPSTPTFTGEVVVCSGVLNEDIVIQSSGNPQWFDDAALSNLLNEGLIYDNELLGNAINTLYITVIENNCPSGILEIPIIREDSLQALILGEEIINACLPEQVALQSSENSLNIWSTGETSQMITVNLAGTYNLTRSNSCNTAVDSVEIIDSSVDATFNLFVPENSFLPVTVQVSNFEPGCDWYLQGEPLFLDENNSFIVDEEINYTIEHQCDNNWGCSDKNLQTFSIQVPSEFYIPNSFTPNGDGDNDVFIPKGYKIESMQMLIFNRWGELIFQSDDKDIGWDGKTQSNTFAPDGLYTCYIKAFDIYQKKYEYRGSVFLFK